MTDKQTKPRSAQNKRPKKRMANSKKKHNALKINDKHRQFALEYAVDLNQTQAYMRVYQCAESTARRAASRLMTNDDIKSLISEALEERSTKVKITAEEVLRRYWLIATANPNELTQVRRLNCRYCYGKDHEWQWIDDDEFEQATQAAERAAREASIDLNKEIEPVYPTDAGGYGFNPKLSPHALCPKCHGEGNIDIHLQDTRFLSEAALALYAGVKTTQNGIEVKMHDQKAALDQVARHLGLFNDKLNLGDAKDAVEELLLEIQGNTIRPKLGEDGGNVR